ncbi:MAG: hypothetical protein WCG48_00025 [Candidatus Berkelbacteria bacterium]
MKSINNQSQSLQQNIAIFTWIISAIVLFLTSIGAYDFIMTISQNTQYFDYMNYGSRQTTYFMNYPLSLTIFWFMGIWGAFAGSVCLLLRLKTARNLFVVAALGQIILDIYTFAFKHRWEILGPKLCTQDLIILVFTILLVIYSQYLINRGFLK